MSTYNGCLQPWRYLLDTARTLSRGGHELVLLTDRRSAVAAGGTLEGLPIHSCMGARWEDPDAVRMARALHADVVLWHLGRTSFLAPRRSGAISLPTIGLFTSPLYRPHELLRCGTGLLCRELRLSGAHLLGLLAPSGAIARTLGGGRLRALVVECEHTRTRLAGCGAAPGRVHVVRPALDSLWLETQLSAEGRQRARRGLGYSDDDLVVGTFGPPAPLRGLPDLLQALAMARVECPRLRLLAFCRQRPGAAAAAGRAMARQVACRDVGEWAQFVNGWTPPDVLAHCLAACDLIALPFRLLSSDVPLSVLEAMALARPVVVTATGCLPELVPRGAGLVVPPAQANALAEAILMLARGDRLRASLGAAARERVVRWQLERGDAKWEQLLSSAMEHASSTWQAQTGRARAPRHAS